MCILRQICHFNIQCIQSIDTVYKGSTTQYTDYVPLPYEYEYMYIDGSYHYILILFADLVCP